MGVQVADLCEAGGGGERVVVGLRREALGLAGTLQGRNSSKEPALGVSVHLQTAGRQAGRPRQPGTGLQRRHTFHPSPTPYPK